MKEKADLILVHGYIISMDEKRRVWKDGAIAVKSGRITHVGRTDEVLAANEGPLFDCGGGAVHPGLIDAHVHVGQHLNRGWEPDTFTVEDTWTQFESRQFPALDAESERAGVALATLEMAKNGTTCFADTGSLFFLDESIEILNRTGIRGIVGRLAGDTFQPELSFLSAPADRILQRTEETLRRYGKHTGLRVFAGVELCGMGECSDTLVCGCKEIARAWGEKMFMHQCVYPSESELYLSRYGATPIRHLAELGVLDHDTSLVHMIHVTDEEVSLLASSGAGVVHCPGASLKYALGASSIGKFPEMNDAGVPIALGTDSGTWADALDIFQMAYLAGTIHREARREMLSINSFRAFEMATIEGAKVIGMGDMIGSLECGKAADIVVHGTDLPEVHSPFDPFTNLLYASRSKSVRDVMVNGEWIVRDRQAVLVDEERIFAEVDRNAALFAKKADYGLHSPWDVII